MELISDGFMNNRAIYCGLGLALTASFASASGLFGPVGDFNVIIRDNFIASNSDVEGRAAIGGNLEVINYSFASGIGNKSGVSLSVGGDFKYTNGQVFKGDVRTKDTTPTTSGFTVLNGTMFSGSGLTVWVPTLVTEMVARSGFVGHAAIDGNTSMTSSTLNLSGGSGSVRYFKVTAAQLASASTIKINAPSSATVVINVTGSSVTMSNSGISLLGGVTESSVLFNFYQATALTVSGINIKGSVLAPQASLVFNNGQINGQVVAKSMSGNGEFHYDPFCGSVPVPEPASMVAMALGGIGLIRARRKKTK